MRIAKGVRIEVGETSPCVLLMAKPQAVDVVLFALIRRFGRFSNGATEGCPMSVRITNLEACLEAVAQRPIHLGAGALPTEPLRIFSRWDFVHRAASIVGLAYSVPGHQECGG